MPVQPAGHDVNEDPAKASPGQVLLVAPGSTTAMLQKEGKSHASSPAGSGPTRSAAGESSRSRHPAQDTASLEDSEDCHLTAVAAGSNVELYKPGQSAQDMASLKDAEDCHSTAAAAGSNVELYNPEAAGTAPSCSTAESGKMMKPATEEEEEDGDDWEEGSEVGAFNDQAIAAVEAEMLYHPEIGDRQKLQEAARNDDGLPDPTKQRRQDGISLTAADSADPDAHEMKLPNPHSGASPVPFAVGAAGSSSFKAEGTASLPLEYILGTRDGMPVRTEAESNPSTSSSFQTSLPGTLFHCPATSFH